MKIVDRRPDRLTLHRRNWTAYSFIGVWIGFAVILSIYIIWTEWPQFWSVSFVLSLPFFGFVMLAFQWWEISAHFERSSDTVTVRHRHLFWVRHETYDLSTLCGITFDLDCDNDEATIMLDFGKDAKSLLLPARLNHFTRPYERPVETLVNDLRIWSGVTS